MSDHMLLNIFKWHFRSSLDKSTNICTETIPPTITKTTTNQTTTTAPADDLQLFITKTLPSQSKRQDDYSNRLWKGTSWTVSCLVQYPRDLLGGTMTSLIQPTRDTSLLKPDTTAKSNTGMISERKPSPGFQNRQLALFTHRSSTRASAGEMPDFDTPCDVNSTTSPQICQNFPNNQRKRERVELVKSCMI